VGTISDDLVNGTSILYRHPAYTVEEALHRLLSRPRAYRNARQALLERPLDCGPNVFPGARGQPARQFPGLGRIDVMSLSPFWSARV
jgi:hypothetical protein